MCWGACNTQRKKLKLDQGNEQFDHFVIGVCVYVLKEVYIWGHWEDSDVFIIPLGTSAKYSNIISFGIVYFISTKPTMAHAYVAWELRAHGWGCGSVFQYLSSKQGALASNLTDWNNTKQWPCVKCQQHLKDAFWLCPLSICKQKSYWLRRSSHWWTRPVFTWC